MHIMTDEEWRKRVEALADEHEARQPHRREPEPLPGDGNQVHIGGAILGAAAIGLVLSIVVLLVASGWPS